MKSTTFNLRIPGPTPLPPRVLNAVSQQMINHRSSSYEEMQKRIIKKLKHFFGTKNEIFLITSSGMGGLEASIVNFFSSGEKVIFLSCGEFGNRWAEIGRRYKLDVIHKKIRSGKGFSRKLVDNILKTENKIAAVFITLNETSTGVLNPVAEIVRAVKHLEYRPLILVDGISALGAVNLPMDESGIDVMVTASQKAWMAPPGIAMIAVSDHAMQKYENSNLPKYYFDLKMYHEYNLKNQTPATPAVATLFGLDASLELMQKEGKDAIFKRHLELRDFLRVQIKKIGFKLFVDEEFASPTVTSIKLPENVDGHEWLYVLRERYNIILAGGMGETNGKIIRIAHMGYVNKGNLEKVLNALEKSIKNKQVLIK